jgi:hypothetical protein
MHEQKPAPENVNVSQTPPLIVLENGCLSLIQRLECVFKTARRRECVGRQGEKVRKKKVQRLKLGGARCFYASVR